MTRFYQRTAGRYICKLCAHTFNSHQAMNYHLLKSKEPCIENALRPSVPFESPEQIVEFSGERLSVPSSVPAPDSHAENRDASGRLRISGMITGYRGWSVGRVDGQFRLFPIFKNSFVPYEKGALTATCGAYGRSRQHVAPDLGCGCGFYASWTFDKVREFTSATNKTLLFGRLKAYGKVLPGEFGWRAQNVILDGIHKPTCGSANCDNEAKHFIVRPDWYKPISPNGRVYPKVNSKQHETYRDTADFAGSNISSAYLGWYCGDHDFATLTEPLYEDYQCNYPTQFSTRCKRQSSLTLKNVPYSWCHEHAPLVFDADEVITELCNYYDVYSFNKETA